MIDVTVLELLETSSVKVNGVKVNVECPICHRKWGVYLTEFGKLPYNWNRCVGCAVERKQTMKSVLSAL